MVGEFIYIVHQVDYNVLAGEDEFSIRFGRENLCYELWKKGSYRKVAEVSAENLEDVFERTNSIEHFWGNNSGVTLEECSKNGCRSTSVGDIIEDEDGNLHLVRSIGFAQIDLKKSTTHPRI